MTRKQLVTRLEYWRKRVAPEWRVTLRADGPDDMDPDDYLAVTQVPTDYHSATMTFTDDLLASDAMEIDRVIVHELIHLLANDIKDAADTLRPGVSEHAWAAYGEYWDRGEERLCDRLSRVIAGGSPYGVDDRQAE